jgi:thioredoxin reductase (NADPH)
VARDLRRRYGEGHRIVRAESGADALDALRQLKLRGERAAVFLADYRMPGMDGVEFLEQAMDIFPLAKRVLLTAYADTDAAIRAINLADLDYYLLKPWDPPEEKLYPVIDDLLEQWKATAKPDFEGCTVIGHRWSARSHEVRDFLARNQVPYRWRDATEDKEAREALATANAGSPDTLPLVRTAAGQVLLAPSNRDLAAAVGLSTAAELPFYDLVVIGGGPAGLGAAVFGVTEGLRTLLVEREAIGGQAGQSSRIENYLGFPVGLSGGDLARRATAQARRFGAELLTTVQVDRLVPRGAARVLALSDGSEIACHSVVISTGVSYTRLPAEGAEQFTGRGVFYGSAMTEAVNCEGSDVYLVGGANSAGQAAVYFARYAGRVNLLVRGDSLERSMSRYLIDQLEKIPNVTIRTCTEVVGVEGEDHLERMTLRDSATGATEQVDASWLFVFIGAAPRTDWLDGIIARDERGFILTGPDLGVDARPTAYAELGRDPFHLETSVPGVFVAGDVRHDSVKRVASAVGEGAMAVSLIHRYLEGAQL